MRKSSLFISFILIVSTSTAQKKMLKLQDTLNSFDSYPIKAMQDWQIPGMAVANVKDNEIIFSNGYGNRKSNS